MIWLTSKSRKTFSFKRSITTNISEEGDGHDKSPQLLSDVGILIGRNFLKSMLKSCLKFHQQWLNQLKALTCGVSRITLFRRLPPLWIPSSEKRMWMGFYWEMRIDQNKTGQLRNETCFSWKPNSVRSENLTDSLDMLKIGWNYKWSYS